MNVENARRKNTNFAKQKKPYIYDILLHNISYLIFLNINLAYVDIKLLKHILTNNVVGNDMNLIFFIK